MRYWLVFIPIFLVIQSCSPMGHSKPEDAGAIPTKYETSIARWFQMNLKDPDSVKNLSISSPRRTRCAIGVYGDFWGWLVVANYRAKNSYGAYSGLSNTNFWFRGNKLVGTTESTGICSEPAGWAGAGRI